MSEDLEFELRYLLVSQLRAGTSMVNPIPWVAMTLEKTELESEVASCVIAIFPSFSDAEPTPYSIITIKAIGDELSKSVHAYVMTRNPAIQTMISLYLGGLVRGRFTNKGRRKSPY